MAKTTVYDGGCFKEVTLKKATWGIGVEGCPMYVEIVQTDGYRYIRRVWVDENGKRYIKSKYGDPTAVSFLRDYCKFSVSYY